MSNRNAAYDFSRFEPQQVPQKPGNDRNNPPKPVLVPKKKRAGRRKGRNLVLLRLRLYEFFPLQ